jgi:hypothetical protein
LAYVASLEERIRAYEANGVQANIHLQKLAKKLDLENRKLKKVLLESCGIGDVDIERADTDILVEEVKAKIGGSTSTTPRPTAPTSRSSSFSGGVIETSLWSYNPSFSPFRGCCIPSAPLSDVRSQKPPTPPPSKDDLGTAGGLLLTLAPQTTPDCGEGLNPSGQRFCGLLQLLAPESGSSATSSAKSIPCRVSCELLKNLIDEQDALGMENAAFELKDGVQMADDGCRVDAKVLTKVLERLSNVDNNVSGRMMSVDV